jgi:hypothetical protein
MAQLCPACGYKRQFVDPPPKTRCPKCKRNYPVTDTAPPELEAAVDTTPQELEIASSAVAPPLELPSATLPAKNRRKLILVGGIAGGFVVLSIAAVTIFKGKLGFGGINAEEKELLRQLHALIARFEVGINYRDYHQGLSDTYTQIKPYLSDPKKASTQEVHDLIRECTIQLLGYDTAWHYKIFENNNSDSVRDPTALNPSTHRLTSNLKLLEREEIFGYNNDGEPLIVVSKKGHGGGGPTIYLDELQKARLAAANAALAKIDATR